MSIKACLIFVHLCVFFFFVFVLRTSFFVKIMLPHVHPEWLFRFFVLSIRCLHITYCSKVFGWFCFLESNPGSYTEYFGGVKIIYLPLLRSGGGVLRLLYTYRFLLHDHQRHRNRLRMILGCFLRCCYYSLVYCGDDHG